MSAWKVGKLKNGAIYSNKCSCLSFWVIKVQYENEFIIKVKGKLIDSKGNVHEGPKNYKLKKELIEEWEIVG